MSTSRSKTAKILYGESDFNVQREQARMMEKAGYSVQLALGRKEVEEAVRKHRFDVVVLGHTLNRDDRHHLPYMAKKANEDVQVLVLHASGKHPGVDASLDSRSGEKAILDALSGLLELVHA
jgi:DNA-binding NtrC family response regulator